MSRADRVAARTQWREVRGRLRRARAAGQEKAAKLGMKGEGHDGRRRLFGKVAGKAFAFWRRTSFGDGLTWWHRVRSLRIKRDHKRGWGYEG